MLTGIAKYMAASDGVGGVEVRFLETVEQWAVGRYRR